MKAALRFVPTAQPTKAVRLTTVPATAARVLAAKHAAPAATRATATAPPLAIARRVRHAPSLPIRALPSQPAGQQHAPALRASPRQLAPRAPHAVVILPVKG